MHDDIAKNKLDLNELRGLHLNQMAHLPLLTLFYLTLQRQVTFTPVTALELSAYLGIEVTVAEGILAFLETRGVVRVFKEGIPAYIIVKDLDAISTKDLIVLLGEFHRLLQEAGRDKAPEELQKSHDKYRKLYSDLASEMLTLFGQESANLLPL